MIVVLKKKHVASTLKVVFMQKESIDFLDGHSIKALVYYIYFINITKMMTNVSYCNV